MAIREAKTEAKVVVSDIGTVLDFLRKNNLNGAETALMLDMLEMRSVDDELGSFGFEKFLSVLPPVKTPAHLRPPETTGGGLRLNSLVSGSDDEFVSLETSSTTSVCSSEFTNPYGVRSESQADSDERLSHFGTARDYHTQNDLYRYDDKDDGFYMTPTFEMTDYLGCPSEDKFVMTEDMRSLSKDYSTDHKHEAQPIDWCLFDKINQTEDIPSYPDFATVYSKTEDNTNSFAKCVVPNGIDGYNVGDNKQIEGEGNQLAEVVGQGYFDTDELQSCHSQEDEYDVFYLKIIHRKSRTGFEENRELPVVLNTVIAGRYYVTEYLGSASFSSVLQARDLQTGIDVCLKIIKNNKDFFDRSLDEIKLVKLVNKHDPGDEQHILRLYDYFYHQEHMFIVCELLKANLYEFQMFTRESGSGPYFNMKRLQVIMRQCLEALEYLHDLGIIHCDLKPENILFKNYRRSEIKIIDLGSSCFLSDNLCLNVQSRSYRAPEVILGLPYNQKIDLWSLGCILAELCSGEVLFPNEAVVTILARMIGILGPIDIEMLEKGQEVPKYFSKDYYLYQINKETNQFEYIVPKVVLLEDQLQTNDVRFTDFIRNLLEINPLRRPTASEALMHPWLSQSYT